MDLLLVVKDPQQVPSRISALIDLSFQLVQDHHDLGHPIQPPNLLESLQQSQQAFIFQPQQLPLLYAPLPLKVSIYTKHLLVLSFFAFPPPSLLKAFQPLP